MASVFDVEAQHGDVDSKITAALERVSQALRVLMWDQTKTHGLSPIQVQFLVYLKHHAEKDRRVSVLAQAFDLTQATVSDAVSTLETKGYLERRTWAQDRRMSVLGLTSEGKTLATELESWADMVRAQLMDFGPKAKLETMQTLMQLIESLQAAGVITVARMCRTCRFFRPNHHETGAPHHCALLDRPLAEADLRIDCPEHELQATQE